MSDEIRHGAHVIDVATPEFIGQIGTVTDFVGDLHSMVTWPHLKGEESAVLSANLRPVELYNSTLINDHAFHRTRAPHYKPPTWDEVRADEALSKRMGRTVAKWSDRDRNGRPFSVVWITDPEGVTVYHFVVDYFTRVACEPPGIDCEHSYASYYVTTYPTANGPDLNQTHVYAVCGEHANKIEKWAEDTITVVRSMPLAIGQHD